MKPERFDLIPPEAERVVARRFGLGAKKHGEDNWKKGGKEFIKACLNHLKAHTASLVEHDPMTHDDDDVGAIIWNAMALAYFRERKPKEFALAFSELRDGRRK